jgi:hypothetical protein
MVSRRIKNQIIEKIEYREKKMFFVLFSVFVFFLISYGVLVNSTIMNAVAKQQMEKDMITLNSEVNAMEFEYINMKNSITMDFAKSLGFVSVSGEHIAVITPTKSTLSINQN